jgi:hypothetical protein
VARAPDDHVVEREFLTLEVWDRLDRNTAEPVARAVERCLPGPWAFRRLEWHEAGNQARWVAFFDWQGREFALIPGGEFVLGYDPPSMRLEFEDDEWHEWDRLVREYGFPPADEYLTSALSPRRVAASCPLLVRTVTEVRKAGDDDDELSFDDRCGQIVAELAADGFRMPTGDEWEYFCAAGTRRLRWWGTENRYQSEAPNAFGLVIAADPYEPELVDDGRGFRGGDGGTAMCGGYGSFLSWLTLTAPFRMSSEEDEAMRSCGEPPRFRRVYPLLSEAFA